MASGSGSECSIKVFARFRPLNESETLAGSYNIAKIPSGSADTVVVAGKTYVYDRVFKPDSSQESVYKESAFPIVQDVLSGYNGTIFAYGQTSSGKTHTMEGVLGDTYLEGIIPRIVNDIFDHILKIEVPTDFLIKVSYFEIYLDRIQDLLDVDGKNLAVHEDKYGTTYVKGCTERFVTSADEILKIIHEGKSNRHVAVTNMNEHSSRSHSVLLVNVVQEIVATKHKLSGKLYMVDLAGSEKVSKTGAEGSVLEEAKNINKSLSALGNVISALSEGTKSHVPYRDSKLTRILQQSLGGNARTTIIICCSPASYNEAETKSTLLFGQRAKSIKNMVAVNEELSAEEWKRRYEKEREKVVRLKAQVAALTAELERWRQGEQVPEADWVNLANFVAASAGAANESGASSVMSASLMVETPSSGIAASISSLSLSSLGGYSNAQQVPSPLHPGASSSALSDDEREKLYKDIDERETEIQALSAQVERLKKDVSEAEQNHFMLNSDLTIAIAERERLQKVHDDDATEMSGLLGVLEEKQTDYEQVVAELEKLKLQEQTFTEELSRFKEEAQLLRAELEATRMANTQQRRRVLDSIAGLMKLYGEVSEVFMLDKDAAASIVDKKLGADSLEAAEHLVDAEAGFTRVRLFINTFKNELRQIIEKSNNLELQYQKQTETLEHLRSNFDENQLLLNQQSAKVVSLSDALQEAETERKILEKRLDSSADECLRLKASGSPLFSANNPLFQAAAKKGQEKQQQQTSAAQVDTLTDGCGQLDLDTLLDTHNKQTTSLRDDLADRNQLIAQLKDSLQHLTLAKEQLQKNHDQVKTKLEEKERELAEQVALSIKREHARQDLDGLKETVDKEMAQLLKLRRAFVTNLKAKMAQEQRGDMFDDEGYDGEQLVPAAVQRQRIAFLENNLEQLTKIHKQLVKDNQELRLEVHKQQRVQTATADRIKRLEAMVETSKMERSVDRSKYQQEINKTKQATSKMERSVDRSKYQQEVNKIKQAVRERYAKRGHANIVRPIHAGYPLSAAMATASNALRVGRREDLPANAAAMNSIRRPYGN